MYAIADKMGNCLTKFGCGRQQLKPEQKHRLEELFQHIVTNAAVDFDNQELKDIQAALNIMLERIMIQVNKQGFFKIARIVPGGSMVEKTSLWKFYDNGQNYLEFDFLAILENSQNYSEGKSGRRNCQGCISSGTQFVVFRGKTVTDKRQFSYLFLMTINHCLVSLCDCLNITTNEYKAIIDKYNYKPVGPTALDHIQGCDMCTVDMPTGTLQVNTEAYVETFYKFPRSNYCSLILRWNSKAMSLSAPNEPLQQFRLVSSLPIHVDFLPAIENMKPSQKGVGNEHAFFVVPKDCKACVLGHLYGTWRKSWCVAEMNAFASNISENHRKCYQILKHLSERYTHIPNYHIKTVMLRHITKCSDARGNSVDCVLVMCGDILHAYETKKLLSFHSNLNILNGVTHDEFISAKESCKELVDVLRSVSMADTLDTLFEYDSDSDYES